VRWRGIWSADAHTVWWFYISTLFVKGERRQETQYILNISTASDLEGRAWVPKLTLNFYLHLHFLYFSMFIFVRFHSLQNTHILHKYKSSTVLKFKCVLIRIVGDGVQLCPLGTAATNRPIVPAPVDYDDGEFGGMMIGRENRSTRRKPAPVSLCPPQTPHTLQDANSKRSSGNTAPNRLHYATVQI
jgi:hypothetical protein